MQKDFLEIGQIVSTHGIKGEVRLNPWADSPDFVKRFKRFYTDKNGSNELKASAVRPHGNVVIIKFDGIDTVENAVAMRNKVLYIRRSDAKLSKGTYFIEELIDCDVFDADDESICYGKITDVSQTGANDVWYITDGNGKEYLIPAIPSVVIETDIEQNKVIIRPMRGIFDNEN